MQSLRAFPRPPRLCFDSTIVCALRICRRHLLRCRLASVSRSRPARPTSARARARGGRPSAARLSICTPPATNDHSQLLHFSARRSLLAAVWNMGRFVPSSSSRLCCPGRRRSARPLKARADLGLAPLCALLALTGIRVSSEPSRAWTPLARHVCDLSSMRAWGLQVISAFPADLSCSLAVTRRRWRTSRSGPAPELFVRRSYELPLFAVEVDGPSLGLR
jgi:hypothetical protein